MARFALLVSRHAVAASVVQGRAEVMPSDDTSCDGFQFLLKQDIAVGFGLGALLIVVELITCARTLRRDVGHDHVAAGENTKRPTFPGLWRQPY